MTPPVSPFPRPLKSGCCGLIVPCNHHGCHQLHVDCVARRPDLRLWNPILAQNLKIRTCLVLEQREDCHCKLQLAVYLVPVGAGVVAKHMADCDCPAFCKPSHRSQDAHVRYGIQQSMDICASVCGSLDAHVVLRWPTTFLAAWAVCMLMHLTHTCLAADCL